MKINFFAKYLIVYILISVIGFAGISLVIHKIDYNNVYNSLSADLYKQAVNIAAQYAPEYFSGENLRTISNTLSTISMLNGTRIMFINTRGNVLLDTSYDIESLMEQDVNEYSTYYLYTIPDFNIDKMGPNHSTNDDFYGLFHEDQLSVYAPIANSFVMKGYVVIHMPSSVIDTRVDATFNTNYVTLLFISILNIAYILLYFFNIHRPLKSISKAIDYYGKGDFSYRIKTQNHDEIGHLADSLDYMASHLDEMDQFQKKFLSNISHDFRSPLTSIKGYLEAMSDGTIPPELMPKYFDILLFETDRLTKLTSNILTLNELDPKLVRLELTNFDINSLIKHTIETFEGTCKKKKIQFQLTFGGETQNVYADKGKIGQVIYNLIDNAIKFSPENSEIAITVRDKGEKVQISVKDSGVGIPKENIDKIWDRFYKSDASRGRDKKGSGLGLSITKEIIQAHEENIDVISTVGVGTEFIFTLPTKGH